jgi:hypothetical protein
LLLAIGAVFLGWQWNLGILFILMIFIIVFLNDSAGKTIHNGFFLLIFTMPIALIKLFTIKEGLAINISFITIYSEGIVQSGNAILRILILALISVIIFKSVFSLDKIKSSKYYQYTVVQILFLSIELYQEMIGGFANFIRARKISGIIQFIDKIYKSLDREIENQE